MERSEQSDYLAINILAEMAKKKLKLAKANPSNKTANTEARFLIYAVNAIFTTIKKEVDDGTDKTGETPSDAR